MIDQILLSKAVGEAIDSLKKYMKEKALSLSFSAQDIEKSLDSHLRFIENWSKEVSFDDLHSSKKLSKVYIKLDYYLTPLRQRFDSKVPKKTELRSIIKGCESHVVILGQPGAGKSTSLKYLCQQILHAEDFFPEKFNFPILIRLRDLTEHINSSVNQDHKSLDNNLFLAIFNTLGLSLNEETINKKSLNINILIEESVINFLEGATPLLMLDGLDEIPQSIFKEKILKNLRSLFLKLAYCKVILTSRSGEFYQNFENTAVFEISPLTTEQIKRFTKKWISDERKSEDLFTQIEKSPYFDTAMRPLTLAHLCAIYQRDGHIPEKPKTLYKKIVNLLIEEWSIQNSVIRKSAYGNFETDRKFEFLCSFAYHLTKKYNTTIFREFEMKNIFSEIYEHFNLPLQQETQIIKEIEAHNGLIVQTEYEKFEFAHKSLQEYLAAEYIVKLPILPNDPKELLSIPNELAITCAISSDPNLYLYNLRRTLGSEFFTANFIQTFLFRLLAEKPDFSSNIMIPVVLIEIQNNYKSPHDFYDISTTINSLLQYEPVAKALKLLPNYYVLKRDLDDSIEITKTEDIKHPYVVYHQPINLIIGRRLYYELYEPERI